MSKLTVSDFSCIDAAELNITRATFIIGPQSSGKSLLSKLVYFFNDLILQTVGVNPVAPAQFLHDAEVNFSKWFPAASWGKDKNFSIKYVAREIEFGVARNKTSKSDRVRFYASPFILSELARHYEAVEQAKRSFASIAKTNPSENVNMLYTLRHAQSERLRELVGDQFFDWQLFIPAGRAFFTTAGKSYAVAKERSGPDRLLIDFGSLLSIMRDRTPGTFKAFERSDASKWSISQTLLGGSIDVENDDFVLTTKDGRTLPSSILSSGQQEILPLLLTLNVWGSAPGTQVYIEEPEAHLWPASQSLLVEYLISLLNGGGPASNMMITTHSPYVLSKVNNLLKAGLLAAEFGLESHNRISSIVPQRQWLDTNIVTAYAIIKGRLVSIKDDSGLIDAEFLDQASADTINQFSELLELQTEMEERLD